MKNNSLDKTNPHLASDEVDKANKIVISENNTNYSAYGIAKGEDRALTAVVSALIAPQTSRNTIKGAKDVTLVLGAGQQEIDFAEIAIIVDYLQSQTGPSCKIIVSIEEDELLEDSLAVNILAFGFCY